MNRNQIQLIGVFVISVILLSSCWFMGPSVKGDGNVTKEERHLAEFTQIKVSRGMNVYITQGSPAKVDVISDNNLHEIITTEVEDGVLTVSANENIRWAKEKKVMVTLEKLSGVETSSGSNAWSQGVIKSGEIELKASSGANLTIELEANDLKAKCSSGANIKLTGLAQNAELEASSGANLRGPDLKTENCIIRASSGGNASSGVNRKIEAHASSGGNVVYYGEPNITEISSSSGGNIHKK